VALAARSRSRGARGLFCLHQSVFIIGLQEDERNPIKRQPIFWSRISHFSTEVSKLSKSGILAVIIPLIFHIFKHYSLMFHQLITT